MKEIQDYIKSRKKLLEDLISFIDDDSEDNQSFFDQTNFLLKENNDENKDIFIQLLSFISKISQNHHRNGLFYKKIESILLHFQDKLKQTLSNYDIYKIFEYDDRILLFLFELKIISLDKKLYSLLFKEDESSDLNKLYYLYPVIKDSIKPNTRKKIESDILNNNQDEKFLEKCHEGENDSYICSLIRKDAIDEFVVYVNKVNCPLDEPIKDSLFETNSFLKEILQERLCLSFLRELIERKNRRKMENNILRLFM